MNAWTGWITTGSSTGNRAITGLGFQPVYLRITLGQKTGTTESFVHQSEGSSTSTTQRCVSIYWDSTGGQSKEYTSKIISHWNRVAGTLTEQIAATLVSLDADGFTLNFSATVTGYHMHVEAFA